MLINWFFLVQLAFISHGLLHHASVYRLFTMARKIETKQPPSKDGGFGLRAESPDTHRLNDASLLRFSTI